MKTPTMCLKIFHLTMVIALVIFFSAKHSCGQSNQGSIGHPTATNYADSITIKALWKRSDSMWQQDPVQSHLLLLEALEKSKAINFNRGTFAVLNKLGSRAQLSGKHREAITFLTQSIAYSQYPENIGNVNVVYNNLGLSYSGIGEYEKALVFYNKALSILGQTKRGNNTTDSIGIYTNIGILWSRLNETTYAVRTFQQAAQIAIRQHDTDQYVGCQANIGELYADKKDWTKAESYLNEALTLSIRHGYPHHMSSAYSGLAMIAQIRKDYPKALNYFNESLRIAIDERMPAYNILGTKAMLGAFYLEVKDYPKATPILLEALAEAQAMNHKELLLELEPKVAGLYAATGLYNDAYKHQLKYSGIKDSLFEQEKAKSLDVLMSSRMAEKDKAMLAQQLHITRQKAELQQKNFWIGGMMLAALLLISISLVFVRNYRHKQTIQQSFIYQLQQKQEIDLLKAQVKGEELERQRIAQELHDGIAGQLWAIKLNVDSLQQQDQTNIVQKKRLDTIFRQLTDATQDVRKTAHNLMPDLLLEEGLATVLASVCQKTRDNTQLEVDFLEYGIIPRLDKEIELSIYRMIQELVQNVLKHAVDATHLLVQLSCVGTLLNITVEDNGIVSNLVESQDGMGLQQIRKRTLALKGHFDFKSSVGKGTTAYLEFDLQRFL